MHWAGKAEALQSTELQAARLQAALTAAQGEAQLARDGMLKIQEQLSPHGWSGRPGPKARRGRCEEKKASRGSKVSPVLR